jgi:hypothetical protein
MQPRHFDQAGQQRIVAPALCRPQQFVAALGRRASFVGHVMAAPGINDNNILKRSGRFGARITRSRGYNGMRKGEFDGHPGWPCKFFFIIVLRNGLNDYSASANAIKSLSARGFSAHAHMLSCALFLGTVAGRI